MSQDKNVSLQESNWNIDYTTNSIASAGDSFKKADYLNLSFDSKNIPCIRVFDANNRRKCEFVTEKVNLDIMLGVYFRHLNFNICYDHESWSVTVVVQVKEIHKGEKKSMVFVLDPLGSHLTSHTGGSGGGYERPH